MAVTKSKWGWLYLAVGFVSCCLMAAVAGANSQNPLQSALLMVVGFLFYVGIFELATLVRTTTRLSAIVLAGLGLVICFVVLMAVGDAVITGEFNLVPSRMKTAWVLPLAVALWTVREIWERRRNSAAK